MTSWRNLVRAPADPLRFLTELARTDGDVARVKVGPVQAWLLAHPDDVRPVFLDRSGRLTKGKGVEGPKRLLGEGLLTSEGAYHDAQRPLVAPAFEAGALEEVATPVIARHAEAEAERWAPGSTVEVFEAFGRLAFDTFAEIALGADPGARDAVARVFAAFDGLTLPFVPFVARLPLPSNARFARARERVDAELARLIAERRRAPRPDLVSLLAGGGMSDRAVRDEVMNLFSGHRSVAVALTWAAHLCARHPELAEGSDTRSILAEAMRLFPPVWVVTRTVGKDGWRTIDGTNIPPRATILVSPWVTHRDPRFHPDPERVDPERFRPEAAAARHPFAYFPFGGGIRSCVGEPLAWLEGSTVLATLIERRRLRPDPGHEVVLAPRVTLRPKDGVRLLVERRSTSSP